jgi:hypothetical protein
MQRPGQKTDAPTLHTWDSLCLFWVVLWLVVGIWTGYQIFQLTDLADSTVQSGQALETAAEGLKTLGDIPVVGAAAADLGDQVAATAAGIVESGTQARSSVRGLAVLIGLAVALGPTGPVLLFYIPLRRARSRDVAELLSALAVPSTHPALRGYLAQRAVSNLTTAQLWSITRDPYGDLAAGRHLALANAELRRLGLSPMPAG